jgi:hypothetical protein
MPGEYIKDLPLYTDVKATDEIIVERVDGLVRTTGRISYENAIGFMISEPAISSGSQSVTIVSLGGSGFEKFATVKVDGVIYPALWQGDNQLDVDITGLAAGSHDFVVYNAYKVSNTETIVTT